MGYLAFRIPILYTYYAHKDARTDSFRVDIFMSNYLFSRNIPIFLICRQ